MLEDLDANEEEEEVIPLLNVNSVLLKSVKMDHFRDDPPLPEEEEENRTAHDNYSVLSRFDGPGCGSASDRVSELNTSGRTGEGRVSRPVSEFRVRRGPDPAVEPELASGAEPWSLAELTEKSANIQDEGIYSVSTKAKPSTFE
ncbi:hypothetical protein EVAR_32583_1 [Eumeta japonica]|uniref:Uncharacterized protein n=1 Tax=Eumeta variegata TaxID=151549 RepID=A0A4C1VRH1_EUMVA|nr:hypothetical protein EVAR_32583_1 [Eumeta japonica]